MRFSLRSNGGGSRGIGKREPPGPLCWFPGDARPLSPPKKASERLPFLIEPNRKSKPGPDGAADALLDLSDHFSG
jgi:hypothetical protein